MHPAYPLAYSTQGNTVIILMLDPGSVHSARDSAELLDDLVRIGGVLAALGAAAVTGILAGYHFLKRKIEQVSNEVGGPASSKTTTTSSDNTLRDKVDRIEQALQMERTERLHQHFENTQRMNCLEAGQTEIKKGNEHLSAMMDTILSKLLDKI